MAEQSIPEVGSEHVFRGVNVRVVAVEQTGGRPSKDGTPATRIRFSPVAMGDPAPFDSARLRDWLRGVQ